MMQRVILALMFVYIVSIQNSWALSEAEIREKIHSVLKVRHPSETGEWWKSLGPTAPALIVSMYFEEKSVYRKIRLIDALGWFDNAEATQFLKREAEANANHAIQNAAWQALAMSQGAREQEYFSKAIKGDNPEVRVAISRGLLTCQDAKAQVLAEEVLKKEKQDWVISKVQAYRNKVMQRKSVRIERKRPRF